MPQNALGQTVIKNEGNAQLDAAVKEVLANKQILARILKECVTEYKDCDIKDIEEKYIEGEPSISSIPVHRTDGTPNIHGMNTEDKTTSEGTQFFDIRFAAMLPGSAERIGLIINIEAQNEFHPGYPLVRRGIYYCCRLISMQYTQEFIEPEYKKIKKVYSIWICTNATDERADTITRYKISEECVKGESRSLPQDYDLMNVVQVNFNEEQEADGLNGFLKVLLSNHLTGQEKEEILANEYSLEFNADLERSVDHMCNISVGVLEKGKALGLAEGIEKGRAEERFEMIRTMLLENELPIEKIAKYAKSTVEEVKKILADMKTE